MFVHPYSSLSRALTGIDTVKTIFLGHVEDYGLTPLLVHSAIVSSN